VFCGEDGGGSAEKVTDEEAGVEPLLREWTALVVTAGRGEDVRRERMDARGRAGALKKCDVVEERPMGKAAERVVEFAPNQNALLAEAGENGVEAGEPTADAKEEGWRVEAQAKGGDLGVGFDGETGEEGAGFGRKSGVGVEEEQPVGVGDGGAGATLATATAAGDEDVRAVLRGDLARAVGALGVDDDDAGTGKALLRGVQRGAEMLGFVESGDDDGERVRGGVAGDAGKVGAVGLGVVDVVLGGEEFARKAEEFRACEGRGENLVGTPRDVVEEFGRGAAKREEVVATVGGRTEHEVGASEAGGGLVERGAIELGTFAGESDDVGGAAGEGGAGGFAQTASEVAVGLWMVVARGAEPRANFGFGLGRSEMDFHLPRRRDLAQVALDHRAVDVGGPFFTEFGGQRCLRKAGARGFDEEQHDGLRGGAAIHEVMKRRVRGRSRKRVTRNCRRCSWSCVSNGFMPRRTGG